jgi:N,N'-diacetyllegionaminate synthase
MTINLPSGTKIGAGHPPYIVAEVGSNIRDFEDAKNSIVLAKSCGASAVKFQLYDYKALYGIDGKFDHCLLQPEWLPKLADKARACGIDFLCTAFSPEGYDLVNEFVPVHKVASAELTHLRLLQKLRTFGKPVILSTGASGEADIRQALGILAGVPVILMYCVAAYPARKVRLSTIDKMAAMFKVPVGYSDHTTDVFEIPYTACSRWHVPVLEKHVNFVNAQGPDAPHSLSTDEFKAMVDHIHEGPGPTIGPTAEEQPMILRHNRRLIATRDIPVGDALVEGVNFGIYRSLKDDTKAASPWAIDQMNGKPVKRAIPAGDGISYSDV